MGNKINGFTLLELVLVILIIGIMAAVAVVSMPDMTDMRIMQAAYKIQSDIRYAQRLAMSAQRRVYVKFSSALDNYSIYIENTPGSLGWVIVDNPLTQQPFTVQLNADEFQGVDITLVYFNGVDLGLIFDQYGVPYSYNEGAGSIVLLGTDPNPAVVRLNGKKDVRVIQNTGRIYIYDV